MDPVAGGFEPAPAALKPMLATAGALPPDDGAWAYEFKWDGIRALVWVDGGRARARSRTGADITDGFPELRAAGRGHGHQPGAARRRARRPRRRGPAVLLAASSTACSSPAPSAVARAARDASGQPRRSSTCSTSTAAPLLDATYDERRTLLEQLGLAGPRLGSHPVVHRRAGRRRAARPRVRARDGGRGGQAAGLALPSRPAEHRLDQGQGPAHPGGRHRRVDAGPGQPAVDLRRPPARRPRRDRRAAR